MAVIKTFFGLILIFVFVVLGYWMYATYTLRSADNAVWDGINGMMPEVLQQWSCREIRERAGSDPAPKSCADFWDVPGPEAAAAPGAENGSAGASPDGRDTAPASAVGAD
jgi:hypothetical protein